MWKGSFVERIMAIRGTSSCQQERGLYAHCAREHDLGVPGQEDLQTEPRAQGVPEQPA